MIKTKEWAASHGIDVDDLLPAIADYNEPIPRTPQEIARRCIILHAIAATGYGVEPGPIIEWLLDQSIWDDASPAEQSLMESTAPGDEELNAACWRQEAEWALLWAINKVDWLGLPIQTCDTGLLVDDVMPGPGDNIQPFVSSAQLRSPGVLLAEIDRTYNLHCFARQAYRQNDLPEDLIYPVLFQRHYAFEWLTGDDQWDEVQTDT